MEITEFDRLKANISNPMYWLSQKGDLQLITEMPTAYRDNAAKLLIRNAHTLYLDALQKLGMEQLETSPITWMTPEAYIRHTPGYQSLVDIDPVLRLLDQGSHWVSLRDGEQVPIRGLDSRVTNAAVEWLGERYGTESVLYVALAAHQQFLETVAAYFETGGYVPQPGDVISVLANRDGGVRMVVERNERPILTFDMPGSYEHLKKSLTNSIKPLDNQHGR